MTQTFLLIPGARLPADVADDVTSRLTETERAALQLFGEGAGRAVEQTLDTGGYRRAPHLVWLWRVITRRQTAPHEAPWRWLALGGREQAPEFWSVSPLTFRDGRVAAETPVLSDREFMALTCAVEPLFMKAGFRLQIWDNNWFATRREDWALTAAPRQGITGLSAEAPFPIEGGAADEARALYRALCTVLETHPVNEERVRAGKPRIDALWISGGGHEELFFPPTLIRSVACSDAAVRGWANASGILIERIGANTGDWPEAPAGDVIAVIDELYEAWCLGDWDRWRASLPAAAEKVRSYRKNAGRFQTDMTLTVLFGEAGSVTLAPEEKSLMKRLFGSRDAGLPFGSWLADQAAPHSGDAA